MILKGDVLGRKGTKIVRKMIILVRKEDLKMVQKIQGGILRTMFVRSDRGTQIQIGVKVLRKVVKEIVREIVKEVCRKVLRKVVRKVVTKVGKWTEERKPPQG
jgi:hypothetical protein